MPPVCHDSAIERDADCQREILGHPARPRHLFGAIESFVAPDILPTIQKAIGAAKSSTAGQPTLFDLLRVLNQPGALVRQARCNACSPQCSCSVRSTSVVIAGVPCVNFTPLGDRQELTGHSMLSWAVFFAQLRQLKDEACILECSDRLHEDVVQNAIGDMYAILSLTCCASSLGWICRRRRFMAIAVRRDVLVAAVHPRCVFDAFSRIATQSYLDLLHATDDDINRELEWAINRPSSQMYGYTVDEALMMDSPPEAVLSAFEIGVLQNYQRLHAGGTFNLSQAKFLAFGDGATLHCITSNGPNWIDAVKRWLTPSETLAMLGFAPTAASSSSRDAGPVHASSFCPKPDSPHARCPSTRSRSAIASQAGNTICVPVAGVFLVCLFALTITTTDDDDPESLLQTKLEDTFECA